MIIFKHSACNSELGVSEEQALAGVVPLPVCRAEDHGFPLLQSFWRPEPEELAAINAGHPIMLEIIGHTHAPLRIMVAAEKE